jgi:hypothetical protein
VNSTSGSDIEEPFGGYKQTGIGRELGEAGLAAYSTVKNAYATSGLTLWIGFGENPIYIAITTCPWPNPR